MAVIDIGILLAVVLSLIFFNAAVWIWTSVCAITLVLIGVFGTLGVFTLIFFWVIFLAIAAFAVLKKQRIRYFTKPIIIDKFSKNMPTISTTEREAIEAGDVWWEQDLFCGDPSWKKLLAIPAPKLSSEEQDFLDNQVETLCGMLNDWDIINVHKDLPPEVWNYLKAQRFFGLVIPKEYGGRGFSALLHSTVVVKIATRSISAAVDTMVPNSLGPAELLVHYGTKDQKDYYLPRLARGDEVPCFALTSPDAGSDAGAMTDTGIVCRGMYENKEVLGISLTWDKRYITLAPIATVLGLAFRLFDPNHLLGPNENIGITLCLIPASHPGVEIGHRHWPMHMAFMNGPTRGKDVFIPMDWIIGGIERAGDGWRMLMECLSIGRGISLPALSTACAQLCYRTTGAYSLLRKQFNTSISKFEGVEEALSSIAGYTYLLEACRVMTAGAVDLNVRPSITSAIAKYHMTETARKIINHATDIHGGHAIQMGPRNVLAPAYMAIPVSITVEGANILTRNLIIFGQGAIRCHPYILHEVELFASTAPDRDAELDKTLMSHIGYFLRNFVRTLCYGLTGGLLIFSPVRGPTARFYRQLTRMSSALALLSDTCMMLLGGELKRKEMISARLGDILSELYLASTVLKYYQDQGQPESDIDSVRWTVQTCLYKIQDACDHLLDNFPSRVLGKILHALIFPYGNAYHKPRDVLNEKIVLPMLSPNAFRDRLTRYCYLSKQENDPIHMADQVLAAQIQIDPLLKKFQKAMRSGTVPTEGRFDDRVYAAQKAGFLASEEVKMLVDFEAMLQEVIKVNEFSFDFSTIIS
ncbi:MAG: acyl-CoA dehydrogenase [Pseudomonadota bacterium]